MQHVSRSRISRPKNLRPGNFRTDLVLQVFIYACITGLSLAIILPCLNILALSFNDGADAARGGISFWPRVFSLDNYREVFRDGKVMRAYRITLLRTVAGTLGKLICTAMAAYAVKNKNLPGRRFINFFITFTMLFGGGVIPTYIQYARLGLINNFWVYVVPSLVDVIHLMMIRTAFETIPDSLEESAKLDGCGYFVCFIRIILPLSKAVIAVVALFTAVGHWNDWFAGAFYMTSDKNWPVATVLRQMLQRAMDVSRADPNTALSLTTLLSREGHIVTSDSLKMSTVVISTVPILCIYPFVQKYFTKGVMIGAVKG
ncbi:MAG: carbohydrate ABC transporter permease [Treponema sp.]|jgi:putative aldouronate transport system permease protein|nr:carbohydrate ABC transporter permease [Treponema sp.]